jgi:hypothetical protein
MTEAVVHTWHEANQRHLMTALHAVKEALARYAGRTEPLPPSPAALPLDAPSALEQVCVLFGLSSFERDVLVLCAGIELDASLAALCAEAQGDPARTAPTFGLALAALPEAHWSAITPQAALRYWRLVDVGSDHALMTSPLRIDERILHFLAGASQLDEHLRGFVYPLPGTALPLVPSHQALVAAIEAGWSQQHDEGMLPVVQLCGTEGTAMRALALQVCARLGLRLYRMPASVAPGGPHEFEVLVRLWEREVALTSSALLVELADAEEAAHKQTVLRFLEQVRGPVFLATPRRLAPTMRPMLAFDVGRPTPAEQHSLWHTALGDDTLRLNGQLGQITAQFDLSAAAIATIGRQASLSNTADLGTQLWQACRRQARPALDDLAQRIEAQATWDDLVLPAPQQRLLQDIARHVRHRQQVYEAWGFRRKSGRGLGISVLFHGISGTGKTMAAEVLAADLDLDLYRIDLSQVVSKYIGETEKNLRRVFDAAEAGGALLLFDEADALFGKRTEVKDSHDRYANIEVSYLLQRMEAYRGLAILTTNLKSTLDDAFTRRIRFMVSFPFPDADLRAAIWQCIFPLDTPTEGLDVAKLARLNVTGGTVRNIALHAAFLAADAGEGVQMKHLQTAARLAFTKLEMPLPESLLRDWI